MEEERWKVRKAHEGPGAFLEWDNYLPKLLPQLIAFFTH